MEFKESQIIDADISRRKFGSEIVAFEKVESIWREKGVIRMSCDFPLVQFLFCVTKTKPYAIAFAVELDFTNYDLYPPSLRFINPFSGECIKGEDIDVEFIQLNKSPLQGGQLQTIRPQPILMKGSDGLPFLCLPGIREYHQHPAHTGDSWYLHRHRGEGRLNWFLDQLYNHSTAFKIQYQIVQTIRLQQSL